MLFETIILNALEHFTKCISISTNSDFFFTWLCVQWALCSDIDDNV